VSSVDSALLAQELRRARGAIRRRLKARFGATNGIPGGGPNLSAAVIDDASLWPLRELYEGTFEVEPVSYATVRDYADSTDTMEGLASATGDMRNVQRCWTVKAVLGTVPRGGRLLEIGAGEPLVAGLLARLGYDVTVVDPYDGSANGPLEYALFQALYPDVRFVRDRFPTREPLADGYDAVYSIAVLEDVPYDTLEELIESAGALVAERGGCTIHSTDFVLAGWGADAHREQMRRIVAAAGLDPAQLDATVEAMRDDPDTYLVSAEAHNRWRGSVPYDAYPMRRTGSLQLFKQAA
jgi:hypothetical protein